MERGPEDEEVDGLDDRQGQRDEEEEHEGGEEEGAGDEGGEAVAGEGAVGFLYVHCAWSRGLTGREGGSGRRGVTKTGMKTMTMMTRIRPWSF